MMVSLHDEQLPIFESAIRLKKNNNNKEKNKILNSLNIDTQGKDKGKDYGQKRFGQRVILSTETIREN